MYKPSLIFIFCFLMVAITRTSFGKTVQLHKINNSSVAAVKSLVKRIIPNYANKFIFEKINSDKDVFEIKQKESKILIRGNDANSMAMGLNYYLKYYCLTAVSWYKSDSIYMPKELPKVKGTIWKVARVKHRFFLNYCTFGYTMPWWQWAQWQRFIDWMALNGINMPLATTGEEAIWQQVWRKFGLSDTQIRSFFTGPAYLPFNRMANLDSWDGPLPQDWIDNQFKLQKRILSSERELSMTPVLPAFAGHVPGVLKFLYPNANIKSLGEWGGFGTQYSSSFLDPLDPLFDSIQKTFVKEQTHLFGTNHIYGIDPFNDLTPPSWEPEYLARISKNIYHSLQVVDPKAQWMQMGWMFYHDNVHWTLPRIQAYLTAVPQNRMILLDYYAENTEIWELTNMFYNQPYIWCYLGNFGGNTMLAGNLLDVERRMENTLENGGNNLWGIGSTLEGFGCNPVMYEYVFEKAWSNGPTNVEKWIRDWAVRRLGRKDENVEKAWKILIDKVYPGTDAHRSRATLTNARPSLTDHGNWTTDPWIGYNNKDLLNAWELMLKPNGNIPDVYKFDIVTIGRQVLGNYFLDIRNQFTDYYNKKDLINLKKTGKEMLKLLDDLNELLATNHSFLLGNWLERAKQFGKNQEEKRYYESDARRIITTWGEKGAHLNDYANRSWADLTATYYKPRWEMFIHDVENALENNTVFNEKKFEQNVKMFEWKWTQEHKDFSIQPKGDCMQVSRYLLKKYEAKIRESK